MFRIICKSVNAFGTTPKPHSFFFLRLQESSSQHSFSVGYLMDQFGFSHKKAISANLPFKNPDKPDAVVSFLKTQDFTDAQIRNLISITNRILLLKPQKTLLPKLQFFRSKGVSSIHLAKMVAFNPYILEASLEDNIVPTFNFFREFLGSDERVIQMLKRNAKLFSSIEYRVKPNIEVLTTAGVPYSNVVYLLINQSLLFLHSEDRLKESIKKVRKMGMDPERCSYNLAISILTVTPSLKWNEKMEAYKRWGCSEDEVLTSFKIQPWVMSLSIEKINGVMSFFVNEMGWKPSEVVRKYYVLLLNLNKRILPRWSVYQELVSKRLVKGECKVSKLFTMKEALFLEQYVNCYKDDAPLLLKLYLEKLEASK